MKSVATLISLLLQQYPTRTVAFSLPSLDTILCSHHRSIHTLLGVLQSPIIQNLDDGYRDLQHRDLSENLTSPYLIHKGRATDMIKRCVSIEGLSLSKGWTTQATQAFQLAIDAIVRANPILTGKLIEVKTSPWPWATKEIHVVPDVYNPKNHSFCTVLKAPDDLLSPREILEEEHYGEVARTKKLFNYVSSSFAPYMLDKPDFTFKQIENESPLFHGKIIIHRIKCIHLAQHDRWKYPC